MLYYNPLEEGFILKVISKTEIEEEREGVRRKN